MIELVTMCLKDLTNIYSNGLISEQTHNYVFNKPNLIFTLNEIWLSLGLIGLDSLTYVSNSSTSGF